MGHNKKTANNCSQTKVLFDQKIWQITQ